LKSTQSKNETQNSITIPLTVKDIPLGNIQLRKNVQQEFFEYIIHQVKTDLANDAHKRIALVARKRSQLLPYQMLFAKENIDYFTPDDLVGALELSDEKLAYNVLLDGYDEILPNYLKGTSKNP
jgi:hypothetical protein